MTFLLLRTTIAMLIAFGGGALGVFLGKMAPHRLNLLVYAAMGALLAVTAFDILPDAWASMCRMSAQRVRFRRSTKPLRSGWAKTSCC